MANKVIKIDLSRLSHVESVEWIETIMAIKKDLASQDKKLTVRYKNTFASHPPQVKIPTCQVQKVAICN